MSRFALSGVEERSPACDSFRKSCRFSRGMSTLGIPSIVRKAGNSFYDNLADLFEAKSRRFGQHVDVKDVCIDGWMIGWGLN